jgi:hypothetical protein
MLLRREWQDWELRRIAGLQDTFLQGRKERSKPPAAIVKMLGEGRRARLADVALAILRDGHSSPFEFEGALRHGIRSALCLESWSWTDADRAAAETVRKAFSLLGVKRPEWHEGQPEARERDPRYDFYRRCLSCGDLIDPDGASSHCSWYCVRISVNRTYRQQHQERVAVAVKLRRAVNPERRKAQQRRAYLRWKEKGWLEPCETCGKQFHVRTGTDRPASRYCSRECYWNRNKPG